MGEVKMRGFAMIALGALSIGFASVPAVAKQYVDYTPQKGSWDINAVSVDPNHVDDYLTGLSKSLVPVFETLKRRGMIDEYRFMSRIGFVKDSPNVLIMTHSKTTGVMDADRERDMAIEAEINAAFSEAQQDAAVAGYEKYRTFIDNGQWIDIKMGK
jgi:hypothetical protein